jgi:hypothetical protein
VHWHDLVFVRNIVRVHSNFWALIDLDAACKLKAEAAMKVTSSCNFPPELARHELDKTDGKADMELVIASEQFEIWYFRLLLLQLCTVNAPTLWPCDQADDMLEESDMHSLAYLWDTIKLQHIGRIFKKGNKYWLAAADLILWCLQSVATRRPSSMDAVLKHKFFYASGELRFLQSTDELWDSFVQRQTNALHAAIESKDSSTVYELFALGGVHVDMINDTIGYHIRPLDRAAFTGDAKVMRVLLDEIPDAFPSDAKAKILDCQTALGYTPYMLACKCGHVEVAQMLIDKGCDPSVMNSSRQTGKKLLDAFHRESELSAVHPWNRGDQLHLMAKRLEQFLDMAKFQLNEHVHAGMRVWSSKQMVWHFNKEQMLAIQAEIRQLVFMRTYTTHIGTQHKHMHANVCTCTHNCMTGHLHTRMHARMRRLRRALILRCTLLT